MQEISIAEDNQWKSCCLTVVAPCVCTLYNLVWLYVYCLSVVSCLLYRLGIVKKVRLIFLLSRSLSGLLFHEEARGKTTIYKGAENPEGRPSFCRASKTHRLTDLENTSPLQRGDPTDRKHMYVLKSRSMS